MTWEGLSPPYATIVADPPWPYRGRGPFGSSIPGVSDGSRNVGDMSYSTMNIRELADLSVGALSADNAHLYLWTTNAFMVEAHELAQAWGFRVKTILTWVKVRHDDPEQVSMKTGYHFRGATEHVIFGVRGSQPLLVSEGIPTAFLWPRVFKHSVKPSAFFDLVERISPAPHVELFARQPRLGWDSWGYGYEAAS